MKSSKNIIFVFFSVVTLIALTGCSKTQPVREEAYSLVSNNNLNIYISEDENFIYRTDTWTVKKMSKSNNTVVDIFIQDTETATPITALECFNGRIYMLLNDTTLVSMNTDGQDILKNDIGDELKNESQGSAITAYTFDDCLYLIAGNSNVYRVNSEQLILEKRNSDVKRMYITENRSLFIKRLDGNIGRIYSIDGDSNEQMFSSPEDKVLINNAYFSDSYIFYPSFSEDYTYIDIFRINSDGNDKTLIESVPVSHFYNIKYDCTDIYLQTPDEIIKINKETLKKTIVLRVTDLTDDFWEAADGKMFSCRGEQMYYIDTSKGEKSYF